MKRLSGLLLLLLLPVPSFGATSLPAVNNWKWPQVLDYYNTKVAAASPGCVVWIEGYGTNQFRMWNRCGVAAVLAGTTHEALRFPGFTGTIPGTGSDSVYTTGGVPMTGCSHGTGINSVSCGSVLAGTVTVVAGFDFKATTGVPFQAGIASGEGKEVYRKIVATCTGADGSGSVPSGPFPGGGFHWGTGSTQSRISNTGSISGLCLAGDSLINDFGTVAPSCTTGSHTIEHILFGRPSRSGSCSCIPMNFGIDEYYPPDTCIFRNVVFDPANMGSNTGMGGGTVGAENGHTFTNADLAGMPSGVGGIPVIGGDAGYPVSVGGSGSGGWVGSGAESGTGFQGSGNATGSGTASGTGSGGGTGGTGSCTDPACDGLEGGVIPSVPDLDGSMETPESGDWIGSITDFLSSGPFGSLFSGAAMNTSGGSCTVSGASIHGASLAWNLCDIPGLDLFPPVLAALAHLCAIFIVFRR